MIHGADRLDQGVLSISIRAVREEDSLVLRIRDNGVGIEAGKLAALRASLERRSVEVFSGVSIGLKNVHERIRLVYGQPYGLEVDSEPNIGTTVRIRIPYSKGGTEDV